MNVKLATYRVFTVTVLIVGCSNTSGTQDTVSNAAVTEGFNNKIPTGLLTPDNVKASISTLKFSDGLPDVDTPQLLYANLLRTLGMEAFINVVPAAELEAMNRGGCPAR